MSIKVPRHSRERRQRRTKAKRKVRAGDQITLVDYGGVLASVPALEEPVREARGLLSGGNSLTKALLAGRASERDREGRAHSQNNPEGGELQP